MKSRIILVVCAAAAGLGLHGAVNVEQDSSVGPSRIIRGGGWNMASSYMRASFRAWNAKTVQVADYGFRVVCRAGLK